MELYSNQLKSFEYDKKHIHGGNNKKGKDVCDDIFTFDIEVSSAWLDGDEVVGYQFGMDDDYWDDVIALSIPYIWQFGANGKVYYGRELREFEKVLADMPTDRHIIIWVHNLSYEFHFLNNFLKWKTVFAKNTHKPIKAIPLNYPNIEFRCTYMLTRLSLEKWGDELGTPKTHELDYDVLRTPLTPLTDEELHYCENDCIVVTEGIKTYLKRYGNLCRIPLTQTGTVREVVKERLFKKPGYRTSILKLLPANAQEYVRLKAIFAGGYTHANYTFSGQHLKTAIEHYDFASSYPTVMVAEKYPMSAFVLMPNKIIDESTFDSFAYIYHIVFTELQCMTENTYLSSSKALNGIVHRIEDNGRIRYADKYEAYITEQDWLTIKETYKWEEVEVIAVWRSRKGYLPKEFTEYILELYYNKTQYKDVEGKEEIYMQSKQYINSMFGMMVTALLPDEVEFDGTQWTSHTHTPSDIDKELNKLAHQPNYTKKVFLSFAWGCWVTAYARRNLWKCIIPNDENVIYCDTDSIFLLKGADFTWYNKEITDKLKKACDTMGLDFESTRPKDVDGKPRPLGIFDKEPECVEFKTLGAKRYLEKRKGENFLRLTVSGINKQAVDCLEDDFDNFKEGFVFDKEHPSVKKMLSTYIQGDVPEVLLDDGYYNTYTWGINLRRTGYKITMTPEYKELIGYEEPIEVGQMFYEKVRGI